MTDFPALIVSRDDATKAYAVTRSRLSEADLMPGDVTVAVEWSTVNYKDGLALTGKGPVVRRFPMVPGIDFAGRVTASGHPDFTVGDEVILNGWGVGEVHFGAYAGLARVKGDWLIKRPAELSARRAMAIGTAGYTAMLAILALERHAITPARGPVLVTGAAGGVGSIAVAVLARLGYTVLASTGRPQEADYLRQLGAGDIVERSELSAPGKPLGRERWAGAVDSVGSTTLANVLAQTSYGGAVAACGLAGGADLPATVMPFILRGVSLLGIDSVNAPISIREEAYRRLVRDLDFDQLDRLTTEVEFADLVDVGHDILAGKVRGRVVVKIG
ncbi:MAG: oxidoreductase [Hyphomicrobiaceae bacterium]|nr:oxidoreductase [Hyphomicrobiaceae bacterium]